MQIFVDYERTATISAPASLLKRLGLGLLRKGILHFGSRTCYVNIAERAEHTDDGIWISSDLMESLLVPVELPFEIRIVNHDIFLGPVIGVLVSSRSKSITPRRRRVFLNYLRNYEQVHGLVFLFALDSVNTLDRSIEGYSYQPASDGWTEGIFPYPAAIFKRTDFSVKLYNHFLMYMGDRIFNAYYFDKLELYQYLSLFPSLRANLIDTKEFSDDTLSIFIEKYSGAFLKPSKGRMGTGAIRLIKTDDGFRLDRRKNRENFQSQMASLVQVKEHLKDLNNQKYLIQQPIALITSGNRVVDFRVLMQKNGSGVWGCSGVVARVGPEGGVVSNISSGGKATTLEDALKESLSLDPKSIFRIRTQMVDLCLQVCLALEACGIHCGDLGLDIGLDQKGHLWIIEANNRDPDHTIALDMKDVQMYYQVKTRPLAYAKFLAMGGESLSGQ